MKDVVTTRALPHRPPGRGQWTHGLRRLGAATIVGATLLLGGCAAFVDATVTTFNQPGTAWTGRQFALAPKPGQQESLEWQSYAAQVADALVGKGLVRAATAEQADLRLEVDYTLTERAQAYHRPVYGYAQVAPVWAWEPYPLRHGGVGYAWRPYYPMTYGVVGSTVAQYRLWTRELKIVLRAGQADGARLYEGTASSEGEIESLPAVMPSLVKALLNDFPGSNGATRRVRVDLQPLPATPAVSGAPSSTSQ